MTWALLSPSGETVGGYYWPDYHYGAVGITADRGELTANGSIFYSVNISGTDDVHFDRDALAPDYDSYQSGGSVTLHAILYRRGAVVSDESIVVTGTPVPPAVPLSAVDLESSVILSWSAPSGGAGGYVLNGGGLAANLDVGNVLTKTDTAPGIYRPLTYTIAAYRVASDGYKVMGPTSPLTVRAIDSVGVLAG